MTTFDLAAFANTSIDTVLETSIIPVPENAYPGTCTAADLKQTPTGRVVLELMWQLDDFDGQIAAATGRTDVKLKQGIFLDMTEHGTLDVSKGKNIGLGRAREATGLNVAGRPFSFGQFIGARALCRVSHRQDKNSDATFDEVKGVTRLP
jgi:hypothetical protein